MICASTPKTGLVVRTRKTPIGVSFFNFACAYPSSKHSLSPHFFIASSSILYHFLRLIVMAPSLAYLLSANAFQRRIHGNSILRRIISSLLTNDCCITPVSCHTRTALILMKNHSTIRRRLDYNVISVINTAFFGL